MSIRKTMALLGALGTILLSSCSTYNETEALELAKETVAAYSSDVSYTSFSATIEGHIRDLWPDGGSGTDTKDVTDSVGDDTSAILHAPTKLSSDNFYEEGDEDKNTGTTQYAIIRSKTLSQNSITELHIEKNDTGLLFYVEHSNLSLRKIYNIKPSYIEVSAKFNIQFQYDSNGYLVKEVVNNEGLYTTDYSGIIDLVATYTYSD